MPSLTDLIAVLICTITPAASVLLLIALVIVENALVRFLRGKRKGGAPITAAKGTKCLAVASPGASLSASRSTTTSSPDDAITTTGSTSNKPPTTRQKVKAVLEVILQVLSVTILLKMASLLAEEIFEMIGERSEEGLFVQTVAAVLIGGVAAVFLVHYAEGGDDHHHGGGGADEASAASKEGEKEHSSRGVIFAMLIHTCAEGLAAGLVMSSKTAENGENKSGSTDDEPANIASMLDITSAYFISLALHNISEGLVVATAVRAEVQAEELAEAKSGAPTAVPTGSNTSSQKEAIRCKSKRWILPAIIKTTLSHIGQPFGLLAVLYAPQLGLEGMTDMPIFVALIQGVSIGSIGAAIVLEALPEVIEAFRNLGAVIKGQVNAGKVKME